MEKSKKLSRRTILSIFIILFLIPLTIWFGIYRLNDRKYYFISMLIIIYTMIPFLLVFEDREPQARELIIIAVLSAIAVAGRAAFFMVQQFKPVVAIVIISGLAFGPESGFLVGAVSGFASNFFAGQGPWTPWQMFSFGIIGFLAGILYEKKLLTSKKLPLSIFGGLATFFIYGGIMDLASLFMFTKEISWPKLLAMYASGFWFNIIHASASFIFLYFISQPMLEKLNRIKVKYGLIKNN